MRSLQLDFSIEFERDVKYFIKSEMRNSSDKIV